MLENCRRRIKGVLSQTGVTKTLLAAQAGVHRNTLNDYEQANWNPNSLTLEALMAAVERLEKAPKA